MRYVTIKDIAAELGISKSTVSRALNDDAHNVSSETMKKIQETAIRMGYRRNEMAVNLRAQSNHVIGISVPEMTTPFSMRFISAAQKHILQRGYRVAIAFSDESPEIEKLNLETFNKSRVDGILINPCHNSANLEIYNSFLNSRVPLVFFDRVIPDLDVSMVRSNDYIKSFFMVEHLIYNGQKRILHLEGPSYIQNAIDRSKGWRDALKKFNLPCGSEYIISGGVLFEDGIHAIEAVLEKGLEFDSVFCFTETQALGAKRALQERGYRIPDDVSICTMSGTVLSTLVYPQITAVEQQIEEMARIATELLWAKIEDFSSPSKSIVLDSKIIKRASTINNV